MHPSLPQICTPVPAHLNHVQRLKSKLWSQSSQKSIRQNCFIQHRCWLPCAWKRMKLLQFSSRLLSYMIRSLSPFSGSQEVNKGATRFVPCLAWKASAEQVDHLWLLGARSAPVGFLIPRISRLGCQHIPMRVSSHCLPSPGPPYYCVCCSSKHLSLQISPLLLKCEAGFPQAGFCPWLTGRRNNTTVMGESPSTHIPELQTWSRRSGTLIR